MLHLVSDTPATWVAAQEPHVDVLLLDHTHCEKKAASTAMNLIFRYQFQPELMRPLSALAREELEHFEMMLDVLAEREILFRPLEPSPYAPRLYKCIRKAEPHRLLDTLLVCSLIEARSCERMKVLSEHLEDAELRTLYKGLLKSEARHHHSYVDLAMELCGRDIARTRLKELAIIEGEIIADGGPDPRMHS